MKKIITLIILFTTLLVGFANATTIKRDFRIVVQEYLRQADSANIDFTAEQKIQNYKLAIEAIQAEINALNKRGDTCQKINQSLWEGNPNQSATDVMQLQRVVFESYKNGPNPKEYSAISYQNMVVDGIYGPNTTYAVKAFQWRNGIFQTGSVGPKTLAKINSFICAGDNSSVCTQEYAPVCGRYICPPTASCDGTLKTFSNSCQARQANYEIISKGVCENNVSSCSTEYAPVCAKYTGPCGPNAKCDYSEKTYRNSCEATKAGRTVQYTGVCNNVRFEIPTPTSV